MAFDDLFKQIFKNLIPIPVISGYSIGTLEKKIDIAYKIGEKEPNMQFFPRIFKKPNSHFIIEYKSHGDNSYSSKDIAKTALYKWGYCYNEELPTDEYDNVYACFIVVEKKPFISKMIQSKELVETSSKGIYTMHNNAIQYVIVINELEIVRENIGLLINSFGDKLKKVVHHINQNYQDYLGLDRYILRKCILVYKKGDEELMAEAKQILDRGTKESIRDALEYLGLEKVVESVGLEKVVESVDKDKLVELLKSKYGYKLSKEKK